jgi:hypothetical protein
MAREALAVRVGAAEAGITSEQIVRAQGDTALGSRIDSVTASLATEVGNREAAVSAEAAARADAVSAVAGTIDTVSATVDGLSATVTTQGEAIVDLDGQYASLSTEVTAQGVTVGDHAEAIATMVDDIEVIGGRRTIGVDVNGRWIGVEINGTPQEGGLNLHADYFSISKPGGGGRTVYEDDAWQVFDDAGNRRVLLGKLP